MLLIIGLASGEAVVRAGFVLLALSAVALLTLVIVTLPRRVVELEPDVSGLWPVIAWPVRVGWWIGAVATGIAYVATMLSTPGGVEISSARFAIGSWLFRGAGATQRRAR